MVYLKIPLVLPVHILRYDLDGLLAGYPFIPKFDLLIMNVAGCAPLVFFARLHSKLSTPSIKLFFVAKYFFQDMISFTMGPTEPDILELPFTDAARGLRYRLSTSDDQASMRTIDSSFVTDRVFQLQSRISNLELGDIGFGLDIKAVQLDTPLHKSFPDDEDSDGDDESPDCFTVVVEDINALSTMDSPTIDPNTTGNNNKIVAFISAKFSSWNARLIITDIEISPLYRRQGIGRNLIRFAEALGSARWPVRHVWLEVSNVNYPAIQSYLKMGFEIAGLDVSLYVGTQAEGEFAIFMWKDVSGSAEAVS